MTIDPATNPGARDPKAASKPGERDAGPSASLAWQREMERAQISTWFQPPLMNQAGIHGVEGHQPQASAPLAVEQAPALPAVTPSQAPSYAAPHAPYGMPNARVSGAVLPPTRQVPPPATTPTGLRAAVIATITKAIDLSTDAPAPPNPSGTASGAAPPAVPDVRVHIEANAHGVAVWVGAPAKDTFPAARLEALLQKLKQSLRQEGTALQSLTVNGRSVWSIPSNTPPLNTPEES